MSKRIMTIKAKNFSSRGFVFEMENYNCGKCSNKKIRAIKATDFNIDLTKLDLHDLGFFMNQMLFNFFDKSIG